MCDIPNPREGNPCPNHVKLWDVGAERARRQRFKYCFGIFLSAFPGMTVTENRPHRGYSVYIPPASSLGDGAGRGEGRKQEMIDGF